MKSMVTSSLIGAASASTAGCAAAASARLAGTAAGWSTRPAAAVGSLSRPRHQRKKAPPPAASTNRTANSVPIRRRGGTNASMESERAAAPGRLWSAQAGSGVGSLMTADCFFTRPCTVAISVAASAADTFAAGASGTLRLAVDCPLWAGPANGSSAAAMSSGVS